MRWAKCQAQPICKPAPSKKNLCANLIELLRNKQAVFDHIVGYDAAAIPDIDGCILFAPQHFAARTAREAENPHCVADDFSSVRRILCRWFTGLGNQ